MKLLEKHPIIDLLIKEIDAAWWSEGCNFGTTAEEADAISEFIREYNSDGHLELICLEFEPPKTD